MPATDLRHYVKVYDGRLDHVMCQRLIDSFHTLSRFHKVNGRGVQAGLDESAWTELNVSALADSGFSRYFHQAIETAVRDYNRDLQLKIAVPGPNKIDDLILKHYVAGGQQQFQPHFDSIYHVSNRYLVLLWYLNDVAEGGETVFPDLGLAVAPRGGRLLVFPPYWMYQHAGRAPLSQDKYILSTYLLF
ncbi:MAG: 2OG-Fe(II) oxygenase [Nevskia sp.]|nr:2OG-Fe(II) oxygenase [Nevskia sp.]